MKYKVGDKIKIIRATIGCLGARGKIGIVTNKKSNNGLGNGREGFNVECSDGEIWRIGFESECELLEEELTAEETIKVLADMCARGCKVCELGKLVKESKYSFCSGYRREHPDEVVEILKQWKKDHEEKPIETEFIWYLLVVEEKTHIVKYEKPLKIERERTTDEQKEELLREWCSEHDGKYYVTAERRCVVKE